MSRARRLRSLNRPPGVVVSLDLTHLSQQELLHEIVQLRRRVYKLAALLRLALALQRTSEFTLTGQRLPDGRDKMRILRAVDPGSRVHAVARRPAISCVCHRAGSTPGDGCRTPARWTIGRPVRARRLTD